MRWQTQRRWITSKIYKRLRRPEYSRVLAQSLPRRDRHSTSLKVAPLLGYTLTKGVYSPGIFYDIGRNAILETDSVERSR